MEFPLRYPHSQSIPNNCTAKQLSANVNIPQSSNRKAALDITHVLVTTLHSTLLSSPVRPFSATSGGGGRSNEVRPFPRFFISTLLVSALYCLILPRASRTIVIPLAYTDDKYCHPASSSVDRLNLPNSHRQRPRNLSTKSAFSGNFFTFISLFAVLAVVMTRSSAIADGPRDALRWSKFCQLL